MNKIERIILVRIKPILLPNIIRKSYPQTRAKNTFVYFLFHFFIFKFIRDLSYLEFFIVCFIFYCLVYFVCHLIIRMIG
jgi:hypothetical protein